MDIIKQKHFLTWMFLLLIVFNIISIGTVWYFHMKRPPGDHPRSEVHPEIIHHFLQEELGLTDEQAQQFNETREMYSDQSREYFDNIHKLKYELINESMATSPDSLKVNQIVESMIENQRKLEFLLFAQFRDLYSICRPDQHEQFQKLIWELLEMNVPPRMQDSGKTGYPRKRPPRM